MKSNLIILGCLAIAGAGIWYFFVKNEAQLGWEEEAYEPVGPIGGHEDSENPEHTYNHLREVMHAAKKLAL